MTSYDYGASGVPGTGRARDPGRPDVVRDVGRDDLSERDVSEHDVGDSSLGDLVGRLTGDLSKLMRAELALAKAEAKEEAVQAGRGAGMLAGAGVGAQLALVFLSLAVMFALDAFMPIGWAAVVVAVAWAVVAAVLASSGRAALKGVTPALPQTTETLKEDAQWAKKPRG